MPAPATVSDPYQFLNLKLRRTLFAHQVEGIKRCLDLKEGFLNLAQTGTGKTTVCVAAASMIPDVKRILVVCPNSVKFNWADEFQLNLEDPPLVKVLDGPLKKRAEVIEGMGDGVLVTNFDSLDTLQRCLGAWRPDLIIADEATAIKNHRAKRTKALKRIRTNYKWAVTGTPVVNNPLDIWSIMDWIKPGVFSSSFYAFRARYCEIYSGAGFPVIKGFKNLPELHARIARLSWRVLKEDCLDLPPKLYSTINVKLSPKEQRVYDQMASELVAEIGDAQVIASTVLSKLIRLQQITGGFIGGGDEPVSVGFSKLDALRELLDSLDGERVVVWAKFKHEVDMIVSGAAAMGRRVVRLTGDESPTERKANVDFFQSPEGAGAVLVGNIAVGGLGINLFAASHMVYYSNDWSFGNRLQSEDRCHRIGQTSKLTIYDLICEQTIDGYVMRALQKKAKLADKITGDDVRRIAYDE